MAEIVSVKLAEGDVLVFHAPNLPPSAVEKAVEGIRALLDGRNDVIIIIAAESDLMAVLEPVDTGVQPSGDQLYRVRSAQ